MLDPRAPRYTAKDIAEDLGISLDRLYRTRGRRHVEDKLPHPYSQNPMVWEGASYRAWRGRFHPAAPVQPAANDTAAHPQSDEQHRADLARHYAAR